MSVLDRSALEASPLADLHAIASELSIDGYRRLRRAELIDAILDRQEGGDGDSAVAEEPAAEPATESVTEEAPRKRRRSRKATEAAEAAEAAEASRGGRGGRGDRGGSGDRDRDRDRD